MNLEDLMAVWKSQDAAPLHDVNRTLLHLALRQEEAKLQKARRNERWMVYVSSVGIIASMALFLGMMISFLNRPGKVVTARDLAVPIVGAVAALLASGVIYAGHRAQARREQQFGESLREQLNRRIEQLDYAATKVPRRTMLILMLMGVIWPTALIYLGLRVNDKSLGDVSPLVVAMLVWCVFAGAMTLRPSVQRALARKRELETLLKELDSQ